MRRKLIRMLRGRSLFFAIFLCLFGSISSAQGPVVIEAGTVLVGDGRVMKDVFIVIRDGKILSIGKGLPQGVALDTLDFSDKIITPGFIAANACMDVVKQKSEEGKEVTPGMNLLYAIDPRAEDFDKAWRSGVTSVYLAPGNRNIFSGTGTILKTTGGTLQDMLVRNQVHLKMVLGREPAEGNSYPSGRDPFHLRNRRPENRMGAVFIIRYTLSGLQNKQSVPEEDLTPEERMFRLVLQGKVPLRINARSYMDIRTAFRLMEEFGFRWILEDGVDAYRYLDELASNDIPVIYGPVYKSRGREDFNRDDDRYLSRTPVLLAERGIRFAFQNNDESPISSFREEAIYAVRLGLSRENALQALTLDAARILGVADRMGSVAAGKDADLLAFDGDPFEPSSTLSGVFIDGKHYDPNK